MTTKVLHIRSSAGFFGAESVIVTLLRHQPDHGISPRLAAIENHFNHNEELVERAQHAGIDADTVPCSARWDSETVARLQVLAKETDADLLHTHDFKSYVYGALVAWRCKLPIVATLHGWIPASFRLRAYRYLEGILLRWFQLLVAVSQPIYQELQQLRIRRAEVEYIPNGVDTDVFAPHDNPAQRRRWGFSNRDHLFCTVARLSREKGHRILVEAFSTIASTRPHVKLLLVGDGREQTELEKLASRLGLSSRIHFAGAQDNIETILADVDCYVSPSLTEGMPMIVLEAMACGIPVIATEVGAVPELLYDNAGVLVDAENVPALAAAMAADADRKSFPTEQTRKARARVVDEYSADIQCKRYAAAYDRVLSNLASRQS